MDITTIKQQAVRFNKSRNNLLLITVFTVVNLFLTAFNSDIYLLFSATAPQLVFEIGRGFAEKFQSNTFMITGLVAAFVLVLFYFVCWLLAKRRRGFILIALIFFITDTLIFVFLTLATGFEASYLLDIFFHGWILYYLINGVLAWKALRGVSFDDFHAALQDVSCRTAITQSTDSNLTNQASISELLQAGEEGIAVSKKVSVSLRPDTKKGRILISANYEDLHISMKRSRGLTELTINGDVYDEVMGIIEGEYSLFADIHNTQIVGKHVPAQSHVYLYANGSLIAKKMRLY